MCQTQIEGQRDYLYVSEMGPWPCVSVYQAGQLTDPQKFSWFPFCSSILVLCGAGSVHLQLLFSLSFGLLSYLFIYCFLLLYYFVCGWTPALHCFVSIFISLFQSNLPPPPFSVTAAVCRAMLSSPTVILSPYGLPVYQQSASCYPGLVQVMSPSAFAYASCLNILLLVSFIFWCIWIPSVYWSTLPVWVCFKTSLAHSTCCVVISIIHSSDYCD